MGLLIFVVSELLIVGDCAVHCRMLSAVAGLYSVDASSAL